MAVPVKEGQWFTTGANVLYTYAGVPKKCVKVSGKRVYFERVEKREGQVGPEYCSIDSVNYVYSSYEHALARYELAIEIRERTFAAIKELYNEFRDRTFAMEPEDKENNA